MPHLCVRLLGPFEATLDGEPLIGFRSNKVRALLAYLAVEPGRRHSRESLAGLLWPDCAEKRAHGNLRSALSNLRQVIRDSANHTPVLSVTRGSLQFSRWSASSVDVWALDRANSVPLEREPSERLEAAVAGYRGDFLDGFSLRRCAAFEQWVSVQREGCRRRISAIVNHLADRHLERGEYSDAERWARRGIELDQWDEVAHRSLMLALAKTGRRSAAVAQYETCKGALARDLNVEPQPETTELFQSIRDGTVDGSPQISQLRALDFGSEILRHTRRFVGRKWLFSEINDWIEAGQSPVFLLTGDPGAGKSAVMAQLVNSHPSVAAHHFCVASLEDALDPVAFARSIAAQLAARLPDYRMALVDRDTPSAEASAGTLFRRLVTDPLRETKHPEPLLIVVDALDEALGVGSHNIADLLCERVQDLPECARLVLSTRVDPQILDMFAAYQVREIVRDEQAHVGDILAYARDRLSEPDLVDLLAARQIDVEETATLISKRAEANFLCVTLMLQGIAAGRIDPSQPDTFPRGLIDNYRRDFARLYPAGDGYHRVRPLLEIISAAREPLSPSKIAELASPDGEGSSAVRVEELMERVVPFFPLRDGKYRPFHQSIVDWLTGTLGLSRAHSVDMARGHKRIASRLLRDYAQGDRSRFTLSHLPKHLIGAGRWHDLATLLTDLHFLEAKCAVGLTYALMADYDAALMSLPESQGEVQSEQARQARLSLYARDLVAFGRGDLDRLEVPPSISPLTEQQISEASRQLVERPTRLDRIRAFARLVSAEAPWLAELAAHHGYAWQQAYNSARDGTAPLLRQQKASERCTPTNVCSCARQANDHRSIPDRFSSDRSRSSSGWLRAYG